MSSLWRVNDLEKELKVKYLFVMEFLTNFFPQYPWKKIFFLDIKTTLLFFMKNIYAFLVSFILFFPLMTTFLL